MYDMAKFYYDNGIWTAEMLQKLVARGNLTQAEYKQIVG